MPDISMCNNKDCSKRNECYRYRAKPNPWRQAYAGFRQDDNGNCAWFWSIDNYEPEYLEECDE